MAVTVMSNGVNKRTSDAGTSSDSWLIRASRSPRRYCPGGGGVLGPDTTYWNGERRLIIFLGNMNEQSAGGHWNLVLEKIEAALPGTSEIKYSVVAAAGKSCKP